MFKSLRDRFRRAGKQAEAEIEPQLDLSYEAYRPEEREKGAVVQAKHLENVMWELELALLESDVAMEAVEALKAKLQQRLVGLRVASRGEIAPTIEKALKAAVMVEDVARTLAYATMIGDISSLPQSEIDANHDRYINRYGTATASTGVTS